MNYFRKPTETSDQHTQPFAPVDAGQPEPIAAGEPLEPIAFGEPIAAARADRGGAAG